MIFSGQILTLLYNIFLKKGLCPFFLVKNKNILINRKWWVFV